MTISARGLLALMVIAIALPGCSSGMMGGLLGEDSSTVAAAAPSGGALAPDMGYAAEGQKVAALYNEGLQLLNEGSHKSAVKKFAELERQFPYSVWATKSILMQAYANYKSYKYDDAINACNRFITLHPGHKDAPYAYYLIALSDYDRIADIKRDQSATLKALAALEEVSRRFPDSPYARDAAKKAVLAKDHLAGKEMEIGRYYLKQGSHLAGINRFRKVVTDYQTTSQTPEALYRLTEGYLALGVVSEAQTAAAVLGQNYPNSEWYRDAYALLGNDGQAPVANEKSWISRAFGG